MKRTTIVSLALLATLGLAGCSAASESGAEYGLPSTVEGGAADLAEGESFQDTDSALGSTPIEDRQVITTGFITVTTDNPAKAAAEAVKVVEGAGGRVDARQEYAPSEGDNGSATLTLRIPSKTQSATLDKLRALGEVAEVSIESTDVTAEVTDLTARIDALKASVARLTTLLATAKDTATLLSVESTLSERQGDLESLQAQQRSLGDQVSLSTITLNLVSDATAVVEEEEQATFLTGLAAGWGAFVAFITGLVVVFGALLPWLVFLAIVLGIAYGVYRVRRQRRATTTDSDVPAA